MVDFTKVARNKFCREEAEAAKELVEDLMKDQGLTDEEVKRCWAIITPVPSTVENRYTAMSYEEASEWFNNTPMPFGKHQGSLLCDVPEAYLEWLSDQPDFRLQLARFLASSYWRK